MLGTLTAIDDAIVRFVSSLKPLFSNRSRAPSFIFVLRLFLLCEDIFSLSLVDDSRDLGFLTTLRGRPEVRRDLLASLVVLLSPDILSVQPSCWLYSFVPLKLSSIILPCNVNEPNLFVPFAFAMYSPSWSESRRERLNVSFTFPRKT